MISVIMPIYNGEKYIHTSIERILKQRYTDIELILVNDGSTDSSLKICEEYREKDKRIKIISKPNGGICAARNDGIRAATGEWISFADQDDNICDGIYDVFSAAISSDVDMIVAGKRMLLIDNSNTVVSDKIYDYREAKLENKHAILQEILNINGDCSMMHIWNCIYRRKTLLDNKILFDENFKFGQEDTLFNTVFALKSRSIVLVNGIVYEYYKRKNFSTSFKKNPNYISDIINYVDVFTETVNSEIERTKDVESQIYTFFLRFSTSLFLAYNRSIEDMTEEKQLEQIFGICRKYLNSRIVNGSVAGGRIKYGYFLILNYFLLHENYRAASRLIGMRRRGKMK